jgi:hydroxyacylglutathione hydrolase
VVGVLAGGFDSWRDAGLPIERSGTISPKDLELTRGKVRVLDVRDDTEFETSGHIPGASHLYVGYLDKHLDTVVPRLNRSDRVVLTCSVGHRASIATSILQRHGYEHVENLLGGMTAWQALELPMKNGAENTVTTLDIEGQRC